MMKARTCQIEEKWEKGQYDNIWDMSERKLGE